MTFDHYTVRLIRQSDTADFFSLVTSNKPRLEAFFPVTVANAESMESFATYIEDRLLRIDQRENYPFVVIDTHSGKIIGYIHVKNIDWGIPKGELGFFIDKQYAGKGILTKATKAVIDHLLKELGFEKIYLRTHETKLPARKLAEKCGFILEGKLRKDHRTTAGELVDLCYYGLLKS